MEITRLSQRAVGLRSNPRAQQVSPRHSGGTWLRGACLLLFAGWAQAFGQVSVLDPSFKVGPGANDIVAALVVQADQRILVGGDFTAIGGCSNSFLARLQPDGSVDASFNPAGQTDGGVNRLLQQPDRKVLVSGGFQRLLGQPRQRLARLLEDGSVDATFDADGLFNTNAWISSLALQADCRVLVGYTDWGEGGLSKVVRLSTNGTPDPTFLCTNVSTSSLFALLPLPDGSVLCGGNPLMRPSDTRSILFRLKPDGQFDDTFDARLELCSVFCLLRQTNGQILVGGALKRIGASNSVPLLRLNPDLQWDETFKPDLFDSQGSFMGPAVYSVLPQPDGKLVVGGYFLQAGGYWRRHIVRLTSEGHVDGCFDPGLGLAEGGEPGPVRAMALQPDGRIVIGGAFYGMDTVFDQFNLARLLPRSDCDLIRAYLVNPGPVYAVATFPPRTHQLPGDVGRSQELADRPERHQLLPLVLGLLDDQPTAGLLPGPASTLSPRLRTSQGAGSSVPREVVACRTPCASNQRGSIARNRWKLCSAPHFW
jgi:uncharacterized delta-60 repeat protein